jgi:hypothetical protein
MFLVLALLPIRTGSVHLLTISAGASSIIFMGSQGLCDQAQPVSAIFSATVFGHCVVIILSCAQYIAIDVVCLSRRPVYWKKYIISSDNPILNACNTRISTISYN